MLSILTAARFVLEGESAVRAILIQEGPSKNGNVWTREALEDMVGKLDGVPVDLYDFSQDGSKRYLSHFGFLYYKLPPAIRQLLPERLAGAQVARVRNARLIEQDGRAAIEADLELDQERGGLFRALVESAKKVGRALGLSVHVPPDGLTERRRADGLREMLGVSRVVGFDVVSFPSAGGRVVPVLEALCTEGEPMLDRLKKLLRLLPEDRRPRLVEAVLEGLEDYQAFVASEDDQVAEIRDAILEGLELTETAPEALPAVLEAFERRAPEESPPGGNSGASRARRSDNHRREGGYSRQRSQDGNAGGRGGGSDDQAALEARIERHDRELREMRVSNGRDLIGAVLESSDLPEASRDFAREELTARLESDGRIDRTAIDQFVAKLKKSLGRQHSAGGGILEGEATDPAGRLRIEHGWTSGERIESAALAMLAGERFGVLEGEGGRTERVPAFQGIRQFYQTVTGDALVEGAPYFHRQRRMNPAMESINWEDNPHFLAFRSRGFGILEATMTTASFPLLLSNLMHKRMVREYQMLDHLWRRIATTVPVSDFKNRNIQRVGEFGQLAVVNENNTPTGYADLTNPTEERIQAAVVKRGGLAKLTWESIVDDDLRAFRKFPGKLARAAERTLNTLVWGKVLNNSTIYDATALFTAGHGNLTSAAYTYAGLIGLRQKMTRQKDIDDEEAGRVRPRYVFAGPELFDDVVADINADGVPNYTITNSGTPATDNYPATQDVENARRQNVLRNRYGLEVIEIHEFDEVAGAEDNVYLTAAPEEAEMIEVGFLNGQEDPSIFVQNMENVGSFFDGDVVTWKVRHVHDGGVVLDYRPFAALIAP